MSDDEIKVFVRETVSYFRQRAECIGVSKCPATSRTDLSQPSQTLMKAICYPNIFQFSTVATKHNCKHEDSTIFRVAILVCYS